ncbi:MAG: amino acid--tRNA ligase-related protein, partial [Candidatus Poseidoniia archaeon]|nr:amino acid--tRNA ligase-related protein [Candidatus Poseidoniia archaeon]
EGEKHSKGFDFMFREVEMTSGGQRVHDITLLEQRLREQELDPTEFDHYLEPFRYGIPPHGGWGLGLDRLAMVFSGAQNVRECVLFPRDRNRLTP